MRSLAKGSRMLLVLSTIMVATLFSKGQAVAQVPSSQIATNSLEADLTRIGRSFDGDIGIAVQDVQTGAVAKFDGDTYFPQQSVSKLWVALAAFAAVDGRRLSLSSSVRLTPADLTLFHQPIAAFVRKNGTYRTTVSSLLSRALQQSDNTANDAVLRKVGGPTAVRAFLQSQGIAGIRFGPGERLMQSRLAGLQWRQRYSVGRSFYAARAKIPMATRRTAFNAYIASPPDGATPAGIAIALCRLKRGELLSRESTNRLLDIMSRTRTGPRRLKAGLPTGWKIAHKTGTGQQLGPVQTGYNDIGIVTSPRGRSYAVVVMIRRTSSPLWSRMQTMQRVSQAVARYDALLPRS